MKFIKKAVATSISILPLIASVNVSAADLTIAAGELPPHMNKQGEGREAEIIRASLEKCGHTVSFKIFPFTRHWDTYKKDSSLDAVTTVPGGFGLDGHASTDYVEYQNGISSLQSANFNPQSLNDLSGKSLVAFAGAEGIIPGLKEAIPGMKKYSEKADQVKQSRLLFSGRADAVLGDALIFFNYNKQLVEQSKNKNLGFNPSQEVKFSPVINATPYQMVFRDPAIQADFDRCFNELKSDGSIQKINEKYVSQFPELIGSGYLGF